MFAGQPISSNDGGAGQPVEDLCQSSKARVESLFDSRGRAFETNDEREIGHARLLAGSKPCIEVIVDPEQDPIELGNQMAAQLSISPSVGKTPFERIKEFGQRIGGVLLVLRLKYGFDPEDRRFSSIGGLLRGVRDNGGACGVIIFNPEKGSKSLPTEIGRIC